MVLTAQVILLVREQEGEAGDVNAAGARVGAGAGADAEVLIIGRERAVNGFIFPRERAGPPLGCLGCFQPKMNPRGGGVVRRKSKGARGCVGQVTKPVAFSGHGMDVRLGDWPGCPSRLGWKGGETFWVNG